MALKNDKTYTRNLYYSIHFVINLKRLLHVEALSFKKFSVD
jgi:hypothetical protein